tara:strand:- start:89 stop:490 length:402 start_codon:yes stop_codon:yes gene_type:complete
MYVLVNDVASYHLFLPWCDDSSVIESKNNKILAQLKIAFKGLQTTLTTQNTVLENKSIDMTLAEGSAFQALSGGWIFLELENTVCEVRLKLSFDFANNLTSKLLDPVFSRICADLVDAFVLRAENVYGKRNLE